MTHRGDTIINIEALVEKHRGCYGESELRHREVMGDECAIEDCPYEADGGSAYCLDHKREQPTMDDGIAWDESGSPVGKIEPKVSCGNSVQRESATPVASQDVSTPAGIHSTVTPASGALLTHDECTPVDVVLLAQSSVLLCKAMAFILLDFNSGVELREQIIEHLDVTRRAMRATGRQLVYDSVFQADGAPTA